ncbi:MAG: hypothetical protein HQM16_02460 [Deltaproteobacteria bacterium]|nr:hypothetical protein [Deltaproteobacteria bacterium]
MKKNSSMSMRLKSSGGFTLFEIVLSIVIAGIIFGVASETMIQQAKTYSFIANRKTTIADVRYAVNRMVHEIRYFETTDISSITASSMSFIDEDGQPATFSLSASGGSLAVFRNSDVIIPKVEDFDIEYQDGTGAVLEPVDGSITDVRRFKITVTTEPMDEEGSITLSTTVIPRSFLGYVNYQ